MKISTKGFFSRVKSSRVELSEEQRKARVPGINQFYHLRDLRPTSRLTDAYSHSSDNVAPCAGHKTLSIDCCAHVSRRR